MKVVSCRPAWVKTSNRFTTLFAEAVQSAGWKVREFAWSPGGMLAPKVILLHWPDELFTSKNAFERSKVAFKLAMLQMARQLFGVRLVWVVHETIPHDTKGKVDWGKKTFLNELDGAIYLSHASKVAAEADIPELKKIPALITRHGHYRDDMEMPPAARRLRDASLKLVYFGQVRPYKNLDGLIRAASDISPDDIQIRIIGWSKDADFTRSLSELAGTAPAVTLDIRNELVPQLDLERALDESDGVVLPYRKILNSGAALFALSRNRPVLAPRLGTLPELQDEIGRDWVRLYSGADIAEEDLRAFATHLRQSTATVTDLSRYEWAPIGESIGAFFDELTQRRGAKRSSTLKPEAEKTWR
ncbi:MAG: glycosyltransferase [Hyphomonadaceae bacterium]|nr:glycosyltransferase [Hyphomonadaceae bacterium]